tara:strand:+ start:3004 stop:3291 length:288 start_codon:yes stop_codon:yes gene_type:complete
MNEVDNMEQNLKEKDSAENTQSSKRERMAKLNMQLARLVCRHCNSTGCWKITKTSKFLRYIQCTACGRNSTVSTNPEVNKTYRDSDIKKMNRKNP